MADVVKNPTATAATAEIPSSIQAIVKEFSGTLTDVDMENLVATSPSVRCEALRMLYQGCEPAHIIKFLLSMATTPDLTRQDRLEAAAQVQRNSGASARSRDCVSKTKSGKKTVDPPPVVTSAMSTTTTTTTARSSGDCTTAPPVTATRKSTSEKQKSANAGKRKTETATPTASTTKAARSVRRAAAASLGDDLAAGDLGEVLKRSDSSMALNRPSKASAKPAAAIANAVRQPRVQQRPEVSSAPHLKKEKNRKAAALQAPRAASANTLISVSPPSSDGDDDDDDDADDEGPFLGGGAGNTPTASHRVCAVLNPQRKQQKANSATVHFAPTEEPVEKPQQKQRCSRDVGNSRPSGGAAAEVVHEESSVRRRRSDGAGSTHETRPSNTARAISFGSNADTGEADGDDLPPTVSKRTSNNGRGTFIGNRSPPPAAQETSERPGGAAEVRGTKPTSVSPGTAMARTLKTRLQGHPPPPPTKKLGGTCTTSPAGDAADAIQDRHDKTALLVCKPQQGQQAIHVTSTAAAHTAAIMAAAERQAQRALSPQVQPPANAKMIVTYVDDVKSARAAGQASTFPHAAFNSNKVPLRGALPDPVEIAYTDLSCGRSSVSPSALPPLDFSALPNHTATAAANDKNGTGDAQTSGALRGAVMERMKRQGTSTYLSPRQGPPATATANARGQQPTPRGHPAKANKATAEGPHRHQVSSPYASPIVTPRGGIVRSHTATPYKRGGAGTPNANTPRSARGEEGDPRRQRAAFKQGPSAAWNETYGVYVTHPNKLRQMPSYNAAMSRNAKPSAAAAAKETTTPSAALQRLSSSATGLPLTARSPQVIANDDAKSNKLRRLSTTNADLLLSQREEPCRFRHSTAVDGVGPSNRSQTIPGTQNGGALTARPRQTNRFFRLHTTSGLARCSDDFSAIGTGRQTVDFREAFSRSHTATAGFARTASRTVWQACYDDVSAEAALSAGYIHSTPFGRLASARTKLTPRPYSSQHHEGSGLAFAPSASFRRLASRYEDFNPNPTTPFRTANTQQSQRKGKEKRAVVTQRQLLRTASRADLYSRRQSAYTHDLSVKPTTDDAAAAAVVAAERLHRRPSTREDHVLCYSARSCVDGQRTAVKGFERLTSQCKRKPKSARGGPSQCTTATAPRVGMRAVPVNSFRRTKSSTGKKSASFVNMASANGNQIFTRTKSSAFVNNNDRENSNNDWASAPIVPSPEASVRRTQAHNVA